MLARVGKLDELLQFRERRAGGNGAVGDLRSFEEAFRDAGDDEGGGGVHDDDVVRWAWLTLENFANEGGILHRSAATEGFEWSWMQAKVGGRDGEGGDAWPADFDDLCFAGERELVEAATPVKHEGAGNAKFGEGFSDQGEHLRRKHTEDLRVGSSRIGEGAEKIEHRAFADLFSRGNGMAGSGMGSRSEEESDADVSNSASGFVQRQVNVYPEGFEHVGGAAKRAHRTIAMFGNARACGRSHNCGGRRNIEGAARIAARPTGVDQVGRLGVARSKYRSGVLAHDSGKATELVGGRWAPVQGQEQANDLGGVHSAGEEFFHDGFGLGPREYSPVFQLGKQIQCGIPLLGCGRDAQASLPVPGDSSKL